MKKLIALLLVLVPFLARAQTAPNWPIGYQPSMAEWNAEFASKQDYAQTGIGNFSSLTVTGGGSLGGIFSGNPTFSGNPIFTGAPTFSGAPVFPSITVLGGGSLSGTFMGNPIFSGSPMFTGSPTFTVKVPGCAGDGVTDDKACLQAALNNGGLISLGPFHYFISGGLSASNIVDIEGQNGNQDIYQTACQPGASAIIVNSDITALTLTGVTGRLSHVCFQMATSAGTRTSGTAVAVGATTTTQQGHFEVVSNTVINAYNAIVVGGATTGATQTNGDLISDNIVISPSNAGIINGQSSLGSSTNGTTIRDNQIVCFAANGAATGLVLYDGSVRYYGGDGGPYGCNIGTAILPATGQLTGGLFDGVLGDTTASYSLLINPSSGGAVNYIRVVGGWTGFSNGTTNNSVSLQGAGSIKEIIFSGFIAHSSNGQTVPMMDMENGSNITIEGSHLVTSGATMSGPALKIGASVTNVTVSGNVIGSLSGTLATGIQVVTGANIFSITGNNIGQATVALSYTPTLAGTDTAIIASNIGIDNNIPVVASAGSVVFPPNPIVEISGTTTINTATGAWSNRQLQLKAVTSGGFTLATGGGAGGFCTGITLTQSQVAYLTWDASPACWSVK